MLRRSATEESSRRRMAPAWPLRVAEVGEEPKMLQKRRVSSAAAETTVSPSGDWARWRTRAVCPVSSQSLVMAGERQRQSWFWEKPWLETISLWCLDQRRAQTWEPVSTEWSMAPVWAFQNLMVRSAVPPPEARRLRCMGHQERALTAAWWWRRVTRGAHSRPSLAAPVALGASGGSREARCAPERAASQRQRKFSLPPEARVEPSAAQERPQTSCWWPTRVAVRWRWALASCWRTRASREPELTQRLTGFQASEPTRAEWPRMERTRVILVVSQSWTAAESVPTQRWAPPGAQETEVTQSPCSSWSSSETSLVAAFQR
mmetsp:Transcript_9753/g.31271  ORF Transcript_9753/g.31271 Transcript_9753/m.31271 type:complete len:319 (-) Transcript_9753:869-1825(-)